MLAGDKFDDSKPRWDLLPLKAVGAVVDVLTYGARKYQPDGWRKVPDARRRYYAAAMRHLAAWWGGSPVDEESGLPHLAHAACCLLFLAELEQHPAEKSKRYAIRDPASGLYWGGPELRWRAVPGCRFSSEQAAHAYARTWGLSDYTLEQHPAEKSEAEEPEEPEEPETDSERYWGGPDQPLRYAIRNSSSGLYWGGPDRGWCNVPDYRFGSKHAAHTHAQLRGLPDYTLVLA